MATISGTNNNDIITPGFVSGGIFGTPSNANDTIFGNGGDDTLSGGKGNDSVDGGTGNNLFIGAKGNDTLNGTSGIDTVDYNNLNTAITLGPTGVVTKAIGGIDSLIRVESIVADADFSSSNTIDSSTATGSATIDVNLSTNSLIVNTGTPFGTLNFSVFNFDNVSGTNNNDAIVGNSNNNNLSGNNGNDSIDGGGGNDTLRGGLGNDTLIGGTGLDAANYFNASGAVIVNLTSGLASGADGVDVLTGIESVVGSGFNDSLTGNSGNNTLDGALGNDTLLGDSGNDSLKGSFGNDVLLGGFGNDTLTGVGADNGVGTIDTLKGGLNADRFTLSNNTTVFYNDGNNSANGFSDYALITDFSIGQGDTIQLEGSAANYVLGSSPIIGQSGTAIYLNTDGTAGVGATDELIAVVQGSTGLNLTASYFNYV